MRVRSFVRYGVAAAMEGAAAHLGWADGLKDRVVAVQGLGNVAQPLIQRLLEKGASDGPSECTRRHTDVHRSYALVV